MRFLATQHVSPVEFIFFVDCEAYDIDLFFRLKEILQGHDSLTCADEIGCHDIFETSID